MKSLHSRLLISLSVLNLLFMHYFFYFRGYLEWTLLYSEFVNLCSVIFDVFVLATISAIISRGKVNSTLLVAYIITFIWSFINVIYGRFFFQYLSLSAFGEIQGLRDDLVINSILAEFHWFDFYYVASLMCFGFLYKKAPRVKINRKDVKRLFFIPLLSLIMTIMAYSSYHFVHPHYRTNWELYKFRVKEFISDPVSGGTPNLSHFQIGIVRVAIYELIDMFTETRLTDKQREEIVKYYSDYSKRTTHGEKDCHVDNVIFILLESFLSSPIDLRINGKEVTPFLNSLKRDSSVYYNDMMKSDIGCGESGDGQFIYMNGILPLTNKMTVSQVKKNVLPSFPKILKKYLDIKHTEIIIPTRPNMWQQSDMNNVYGIDSCYAQMEIAGDLMSSITDEQVFNYAAKSLSQAKVPFFSLILSVSTHSPYNKFLGDNITVGSTEYSDEYNNYLNTCHYTDMHLMRYISALKEKGLYNNSLIIIAADHYAHIDALNMRGKVDDYTPLFIINGHFNVNDSWKGEFRQLDTYTTILDILNIKSEWRGLGYTLLLNNYKNSVDETSRRISKEIIEGDFFAQ